MQTERQPEQQGDGAAPKRRTEQGDELSDEHSIARQRGEPENPYRPPRQPAQDPPAEDDEGGF